MITEYCYVLPEFDLIAELKFLLLENLSINNEHNVFYILKNYFIYKMVFYVKSENKSFDKDYKFRL